jgi:Chaperone of endosialidase
MRFLAFVAVAAGSSFLFVSTVPNATNANPVRRLAFPAQHAGLKAERPTPSLRRNYGNGPTPCTVQYGNTDSFNGISDDVAGGEGSGVLAGNLNAACDAYSGITAGFENEVAGGSASYSVVAGGLYNVVTGAQAFIGSGYESYVSGNGSVIGGGASEYNDDYGGPLFGSQISGIDSFIGAGDVNNVSGNGSFIGAGDYAYEGSGTTASGNQVAGNDSFIGTGDQNSVAANEAFIGSGGLNTIDSGGTYATILGGNRNTVTGEYASILGGFGSLASGAYAIVAGGDADTAAGTLSFAAGYHADAGHNGSFVWSDFSSGSATLKDTAVNQFVARASGGVYLYSNEAMTSGVKLAAGSGTWASVSDRNVKTDIAPLNDASILAKVTALPVNVWRYKSEAGVRHVGPMAQDFYAAFGVGEDDRHITTIDEDGVALAAIKGLSEKVERKDGEIAALRAELHRLEAAFAAETLRRR